MPTLEETIYQIVKRALRDLIEEEKENGVFTSNTEKFMVKNYPQPFKQLDPLSVIRPKELCKLLSVSTATLWRMEQDEQLPTKIQIGSRSVGWLRRDIEQWLVSKKKDI